MKIHPDYMAVMRRGKWINKTMYRKEQEAAWQFIVSLTLAMLLCLFVALTANAQVIIVGDVPIDMSKIEKIESSGNPLAYNKKSKCRGLFQISEIVLKEWNNFHPKNQYLPSDLFQGTVNRSIANWYISQRIPQLLKHFKQPITLENMILAYNAGIKFVIDKKMPNETKQYIKKYKGR